MTYSRYTWSFAAAIVLLTIAALASFREISALAAGGAQRETRLTWPGDTLTTVAGGATASPSYAELAVADEGWRRQYAPQYTLSELRARGDGRRSPRQAMQDRVYSLTRRGARGAAIGELERWVASHRGDGDALLWLARLLNEAGRSRESVTRYRQALALEARAR
jgi:hypothetical protein